MTNINAVSERDINLFAERPLMNEYQRLATRSAIYPGKGTPLGLAYVALKLNGEAGELAEHVGKAMRDDGFIKLEGASGYLHSFSELTPKRQEAIIKEAGDVLWYVSGGGQ